MEKITKLFNRKLRFPKTKQQIILLMILFSIFMCYGAYGLFYNFLVDRSTFRPNIQTFLIGVIANIWFIYKWKKLKKAEDDLKMK